MNLLYRYYNQQCFNGLMVSYMHDCVPFTFTFMHLADAFLQSDLHCIQVTVFTFLSTLAFPGNRTHDLGVASAMLYQLSYRKAVPRCEGHFVSSVYLNTFSSLYGIFFSEYAFEQHALLKAQYI